MHHFINLEPWGINSNAGEIIVELIAKLDLNEHQIVDNIALHNTAIIEMGAVLKVPMMIVYI